MDNEKMEIDKLDSMYGSFIESSTIQVWSNWMSLTEYPDDVEAFQLNETVRYHRSEFTQESKDVNAICTYFIPYHIANLMSDDYDFGVKYLSVVQNEIYLKLSPYIKNGRKVKWRIPGNKKKFFRDSPMNGIELRAMVDGKY